MKNGVASWFVLLLVPITSVCVPAAAQEGGGVSSPRSAIVRFFNGLAAADQTTLQQVIFTGGLRRLENEKAAFIDVVMAQKRLEAAAIKRWGDAGKRFSPHFDLVFTDADRASLARAEIYLYEGGRAAVYLAGQTSPIRLRRFEGRWQVILDVIGDPEAMDQHAPIPPQIPKETVAVAEGVEKGQYDTPVAAEADLAARLAKIPPAQAVPSGRFQGFLPGGHGR